MNHFVFLFPDRNHIDFDSALEGSDIDRQMRYLHTLNACIDSRYRKKGFKINHVLFKDEELSRYIKKNDSDTILFSDMSLDDMKKRYSEKHDYHIDTHEILSRLTPAPIDRLIVGGFFLTDCVDKFARDAYHDGLDVLVDEDLTDMLLTTMDRPGFRIGRYPNYNPLNLSQEMRTMMSNNRKDKPWLWQFHI
ncbi:MAG: hypothetical protein ACP5NW_02010 [Candidatus Woesearchaeota archaeon]